MPIIFYSSCSLELPGAILKEIWDTNLISGDSDSVDLLWDRKWDIFEKFLIYMWNLKKTAQWTNKTEKTHRYREQIGGWLSRVEWGTDKIGESSGPKLQLWNK